MTCQREEFTASETKTEKQYLCVETNDLAVYN